MIESIIDKVLPQSIEGEMAVLGAMLIEKEAVPKALEIVNEKHFYRESHRRIFEVIKSLYLENVPIDTITVTEELKNRNLLAEVGGAAYIATLINNVSTAANVEHYAKIVREKSILRQMIQYGTKIVEEGYKSNKDADELLNEAEQLILSIAESRITQGFVPAKDIIKTTLEHIESLITSKKNVPGLPTGFIDIDAMTGGLHPSNFIIVAGRTSMGKTSLCMNIVANVAIRSKIPVAVFSLETSVEDLTFRLICSEAKISGFLIRKGVLPFTKQKTWTKITDAAQRLYDGAPIFIDDSSVLNVIEMRTRARRLKHELELQNKNLGLIVVDYIQLMRSSTVKENRQQEISEISLALKSVARELKIPVIGISQLSRKPEEKGREGRPQLSDLRESGSLEQDADLVMLIYREEVYKKDDISLAGKAKIIIAKHRNGPVGEVDLYFDKDTMRFENLTDKRE
jgi:replicative DNA helicase